MHDMSIESGIGFLDINYGLVSTTIDKSDKVDGVLRTIKQLFEGVGTAKRITKVVKTIIEIVKYTIGTLSEQVKNFSKLLGDYHDLTDILIMPVALYDLGQLIKGKVKGWMKRVGTVCQTFGRIMTGMRLLQGLKVINWAPLVAKVGAVPIFGVVGCSLGIISITLSAIDDIKKLSNKKEQAKRAEEQWQAACYNTFQVEFAKAHFDEEFKKAIEFVEYLDSTKASYQKELARDCDAAGVDRYELIEVLRRYNAIIVPSWNDKTQLIRLIAAAAKKIEDFRVADFSESVQKFTELCGTNQFLESSLKKFNDHSVTSDKLKIAKCARQHMEECITKLQRTAKEESTRLSCLEFLNYNGPFHNEDSRRMAIRNQDPTEYPRIFEAHKHAKLLKNDQLISKTEELFKKTLQARLKFDEGHFDADYVERKLASLQKYVRKVDSAAYTDDYISNQADFHLKMAAVGRAKLRSTGLSLISKVMNIVLVTMVMLAISGTAAVAFGTLPMITMVAISTFYGFGKFCHDRMTIYDVARMPKTYLQKMLENTPEAANSIGELKLHLNPILS